MLMRNLSVRRAKFQSNTFSNSRKGEDFYDIDTIDKFKLEQEKLPQIEQS